MVPQWLSFKSSDVHSQPMSIPSSRGMRSRDSCWQLDTQNSLGTSGKLFDWPLAREGSSPALFENSGSFGTVFLRIEAN